MLAEIDAYSNNRAIIWSELLEFQMQFVKLVITVAIGAICVAARLSAAERDLYSPRTLDLHALRDCKLHTGWIGFWPRFPEGIWLKCGDREFLVLQPNNLLGHVHISTAEEALEYVRLFSSPDTFKCFAMDGMVEIVEGNPESPGAAFNVVKPSIFKRHFRRARAVEADSHPCKPGVAFACGREFRITRVAVFSDQHIYEVVESVYESGFYGIISKRLLIKDATRVGVLHFGDL